MKKIITLLFILAGLIGAAVIYQKNQKISLSTASSLGTKTRERLLPDFDITAVRKLRLRDDKSEVNLIISEDQKTATVLERGGYAASLDRINSAISQLYEQRIASKQEVGKTAWSEIDVQPPGEGFSGVGTQIEMVGDGGKIIKSLILGKPISTTGGRSSTQFSGGDQRFIRLPEDGNTIWVVSNTFMELMPEPQEWLDKSFLDVKDIKEATVTPPQAEEGWRVARSNNPNGMSLADAKVGESLDETKLDLNTLLSSPVFNDVVPKDQVKDLLKDAVQAKIVTYEGFTYDLKLAKKAKDGADRYYMEVNVSADLPKTRPAVAGEKEEDKKKADEAFAAKRKALEEKLAKEQKFNGWVYEVSEYSVNTFFKKRSEIVRVSAKATPAPSSPDASIVPKIPGLNFSAPSAPAPAPVPEAVPTPSAPSPAPAEAAPPAAPAPEVKPESAPAAAPEAAPAAPKP